MKPLNYLLIIFWLFPSLVHSESLADQRNLFLQAEKHLRQNEINAFINDLSRLAEYPLYPYLQYQWLKNNLQETERIKSFLNTSSNTYYADHLRKKWLNSLANHRQWPAYLKHYRFDGDSSRECLFHWARYQTGHIEPALTEARRLWSKHLPTEECKPLFLKFIHSPRADPELIWQYFERASTANDTTLAKQLHDLLPIQQQKAAKLWLQIERTPTLILKNGFLPLEHPQAGHLFSEGIRKIAQSDIDKAITTWDERPSKLIIHAQDQLSVERRLSLTLAYRDDKRAFQRLMHFTGPDEDVNAWRVRVALKEQNWQHVAQALIRLSAQQKQQAKWRYWLARCWQALGNRELANGQYRQLARERNFYGFWAAEQIGVPYSLTDRPLSPSQTQTDELLKLPEFQAIRELKHFNRLLDARRAWLFAINRLTREQLAAAAKLAEQWQWDQLAIMTLAKADYWDDIALRFPIRHLDLIRPITRRLQLNPAIILAIIRQESLFYDQAYSPAGAIGLMQLLPETGQFIAKQLNDPLPSNRRLFNANLNVRYGSHYLKYLLERFNQHFILAIAAYNAGPNRVDKWLPSEQNLPAEIWMETIPYRETRKYLANVLFYTVIYRLRTQDANTPNLKNFLHLVPSLKN